MQDVVKIALAKQLGKETKNLKLDPGQYDVDETITVRINGTVKKAEDNEYTPTVDVPLKATLALVLQKAGFQRENAKRILVEAMTEALELDTQAGPVIEERLADIDAAMAHVQEVTDDLPKKTRTGATTIKLTLEQVDPANVA